MKVIIILIPLFFHFSIFSKINVRTDKAPDLKEVVNGYVNNSGVRMNFEKVVYLKLLNKTRKSQGEISLSKKSLSLTLTDHLKTRIISNGSMLWYITSPEGEKKKTVKMDLKKMNQDKAFLSLLFNPELLFQKFRFVSSRPKGRVWILNFEATQPTFEISSFSVKLDGKMLLEAQLKWRELGNEEKYIFSNIRFNQKIPSSFFLVSSL